MLTEIEKEFLRANARHAARRIQAELDAQETCEHDLVDLIYGRNGQLPGRQEIRRAIDKLMREIKRLRYAD